MASYVDIANLAASKIGEDDQLTAPDDDTHLGRSVAAVWSIVRQATLRDHPWNFAVKRVAIAADAKAAPVGFQYAYPLPADCLRLVGLIDHPTSRNFELEGRAILFDATGPLRIRYIVDVEEPAYWDSDFTEAFACRLAYAIADRITGDSGRKSEAWNAYTLALRQAKKSDALENPGPVEASSPWEEARFGWGDHGLYERVYRGSSTYP